MHENKRGQEHQRRWGEGGLGAKRTVARIRYEPTDSKKKGLN